MLSGHRWGRRTRRHLLCREQQDERNLCILSEERCHRPSVLVLFCGGGQGVRLTFCPSPETWGPRRAPHVFAPIEPDPQKVLVRGNLALLTTPLPVVRSAQGRPPIRTARPTGLTPWLRHDVPWMVTCAVLSQANVRCWPHRGLVAVTENRDAQ